jgi:hypothetical protein
MANNADSPFTSVTVIGNEVQLFGGAGLALPSYQFVGTFSINLLEIIDEANCVVGVGAYCFSDYMTYICTNLSTVLLPATEYVNDFAFFTCSTLLNTNFDQMINAEQYAFYGCSSLLGFDAPVAISFGEGCFSSCSGVITITAPNLVTAGNQCFSYTSAAEYYDFPSLETVGNQCFMMMYDSALLTIDLPVATTIGNGAFYGCIFVTDIYMPLCTSLGSDPTIDDGMFYYIEHGGLYSDDYDEGLTFLEIVDLGLADIPGSSFNSTTGRFTVPYHYVTITVHESLLTINNGGLHADLFELLAHTSYNFSNPDTPSYPTIPDWSVLSPPAGITLACGFDTIIITGLGTYIPEVPLGAVYPTTTTTTTV